MNHLEHPLVRQHLATVAQETTALPAGRREELLADLKEHISIALAGADEQTDETVQQVLDELGTPRTIAESALAEEPVPTTDELLAGSDLRTGLTLILLPVAGSIGVFLTTLGFTAGVVGLALLWTSKQWNTRDRLLGTLIPVSSIAVWIGLELVFAAAGFEMSVPRMALTAALALAAPLLGSVYLFRAARRRNTRPATLRT